MTDTACLTARLFIVFVINYHLWFRPIIVKIIHDKKAYNFNEKFMEKNLMPISYLQDGLIVIAH